MYQRARKLAQLAGNGPDQFMKLAELQLEAYVVSINALSLIDQKNAWIVLPVSVETGNEVRACPEERLNSGTQLLRSAQEKAQAIQIHPGVKVRSGKARRRSGRAR